MAANPVKGVILMHRTHYCGELRKEHMGQAATCCGWVQTRRDMGGVSFRSEEHI